MSQIVIGNPIVIIIRLDSDEMPDATAPMLFLKIPGLNISSERHSSKLDSWLGGLSQTQCIHDQFSFMV
jgi:hypothetical protein